MALSVIYRDGQVGIDVDQSFIRLEGAIDSNCTGGPISKSAEEISKQTLLYLISHAY